MDGPEHFHWCSIRSLNKRVVQILTWNNLRFYSQTACGAMKMAVYWSLWSSSGTSSDFGGVATWGLYTLKKNERLVRLKVTNNWKNSNIIWTENLQPTTWFFNRRFFLSITYLGGFHQTSEDCLNLGGGSCHRINPQLRSWRDFEMLMETYHFPWRRVRIPNF